MEGPLVVKAAAEPRVRRPVLGFALVFVAATLFGINGSVAKVALSSGLSSLRLTEARCAGACIGLMLIVLIRSPGALRIDRRSFLRLAVFGVVGVALVQLFYFLAIRRLEIGIALLIQYLGPLLVAIWARTFGHERVRARIWAALALSLTGLSLMVELWSGVSLDGLGSAFALISAVIFAAYLLLAEREVAYRDSISLMAWGFFFATVFWTIVQPWWSFPAHRVGQTISLEGRLAAWHLPLWALVLWVIVLGSIVPFTLFVGALRHLSATGSGSPRCSSRSSRRSLLGPGSRSPSHRPNSPAPRSSWPGSCSPRRPASDPPNGGLTASGPHAKLARVLRKNHIYALLVGAFLLVAAAPQALAGTGGTSAERSLLAAVNATRASHGLQPLRLAAPLERAAQSHSTDMLRHNYFAHGNFDGRMQAFQVPGPSVGENLAWGTGSYGRAGSIVQEWLASPEHRANLLRPGYSRIGIGVARGSFLGTGAAVVVTADFAGR